MLICEDSITELEMMSINFGELERQVSAVGAIRINYWYVFIGEFKDREKD